ncbi:hypothetical protein ACQB6R_05445 [Propionibacteriaceae bacterium G1746]
MRWSNPFSSRVPLDEQLAAELRRGRPEAGRVLAVGAGPDGVVVVATQECLAIHRPHPTADQQRWEFVGWHLISRGGWDRETGRLRWTFVDQSSGSVVLTEAGSVPPVFRDRVQASIVVEQVFPAPGGGHVVIAGRRQLANQTSGLVWQVTTMGAARLSNPDVAEYVTLKTAQLKSDYEQ